MKILLIYYGEEDKQFNDIICHKKIFVKKEPYFNFNSLLNKIKKYDYLIFLEDTYDYTNCINSINKVLVKMENYGQIIFNSSEKKGSKVYEIPEIEYDVYRSITKSNRIFKNLSKSDMKQSNGINYEAFANKNVQTNVFRLIPSVIDVKKFIVGEFDLRKNEHIEYMYGLELKKNGFKVGYIDMDMNKVGNSQVMVDNSDGENITIVSGYLKLKVKRPPKKDTPDQVYDYLDKARATLMIPQRMVLYLSEEVVDEVRKIREEAGLMDRTRIVVITEEENLYMYGEMGKVRGNVEKNVSPYDIPEYICAVNSRYGYMENAIKKNYFGTDYYAWVDFSAGHIVEIPKNMKITYSQHEKVRIGWIARYNGKGFVYNHYCLGGGIFVGHKEIMMELVRLHDEKFRELMEMGYNINDDKLLFTIMERYPYMFDVYFSGYKGLYGKM